MAEMMRQRSRVRIAFVSAATGTMPARIGEFDKCAVLIGRNDSAYHLRADRIAGSPEAAPQDFTMRSTGSGGPAAGGAASAKPKGHFLFGGCHMAAMPGPWSGRTLTA